MENKKFIDSVKADGISVLTDSGYQPLTYSHKTIPYNIWEIKTSGGLKLLCADDHILFKSNGHEVFVKNLVKGDIILVDGGTDVITSISESNKKISMYDLTVNHKNHRYYTNGILSHNSTVCLDIISNAKANGAKVLFISAEMNKVDLYLYVKRYPKFGDLKILFPQELDEDENPKKVLEELFNDGYDIILIDSFVELQEIISESTHMTKKSVEKYLLGLMYKHNLGQNKENKYTSFLNIQQMNKGGNFTGSMKLKHMTTGMVEIRFVDEDTQDERYIVFTKNRRGHVGKQMFFDLISNGDVVYDTERFKKAEELKKLKKIEREKLKESSKDFDKLFGLDVDTEDEDN